MEQFRDKYLRCNSFTEFSCKTKKHITTHLESRSTKMFRKTIEIPQRAQIFKSNCCLIHTKISIVKFRIRKGKLKDYNLTENRYELSESFPEIKYDYRFADINTLFISY